MRDINYKFIIVSSFYKLGQIIFIPGMSKLTYKNARAPEEHDEDPRIQSKYSTPKYMEDGHYKSMTYLTNMNSNEKTQPRHTGYFRKVHTQINNYEPLEKEFEEKIKAYSIVSGTLRQYLRTEKKSNQKNKSKLLNTTIQIIKAFAKTQITEISPSVTELINEILDTLPIQKPKSKKHNKTSKSNSKKCIQDKTSLKQFSFSKEKKWQIPKHFNERQLRQQIRQYEENLAQLKDQAYNLQQIKAQYESLNQQQKKQYIKSLQQIAEKQKRMLEQLSSQY